jgi:hypothetical protein
MTRDGGYHHGDLRAALIATAIDLIEEQGVRSFSLAEASRRLGVAVSAGLDKNRHPEVKTAEAPISEAFQDCVRALSDAEHSPEVLATALEAVVHGHARFLLHGEFGEGPDAVELAAGRAALAVSALLEWRHALRVAAGP